MNEMLRIQPEGSRLERSGQAENVMTEFGGVYRDEDGIFHAVTLDGEGVVAIPPDVAASVSLALKVQDKVFSGSFPQLEKKLALLNCRKSIFVAADKMPLRDAVAADSEDIDGLQHLFEDVERIQNAGFAPHLVTESYVGEVGDYLDEYEGAFPCVVHIFEFPKNSKRAEAVEQSALTHGHISDDVVRSLHRVHSFMVLGEDEHGYVCFQKMGPEIEKPFMIAGLDHMLFTYPLEETREGVVFIGPL